MLICTWCRDRNAGPIIGWKLTVTTASFLARVAEKRLGICAGIPEAYALFLSANIWSRTSEESDVATRILDVSIQNGSGPALCDGRSSLHIDKPNEQILLTVPHSFSCDSRGCPLPEIPRLEWSQQHALSETHILLIDPALKKHHAPTVHNAIPHPCDKAQESCTSSDPRSTCNPTSHNISNPPLPNNPNPLPPVNVRPHTDNLALTP
jgi:hypothetical protein